MSDAKYKDQFANCTLTWEHFQDDDTQTIWRIVWIRKWGKNRDKSYRCTDYFNSEKSVWEFAALQIERGHEVIRVGKFEGVPTNTLKGTKE